MCVLKIEDPAHIQLPEDVRECLGLKRGDVIVITLEAQRVILEKWVSSLVDASFGLWAISRLNPRMSISCVTSGTHASQSGCPMDKFLLDSDILIDHLRGHETAR